MRVTSFEPGPRLGPFVARLSTVESDDEVTRVLMPECGLVLGVRYAGAASLVAFEGPRRLADASLTGVQSRVRHMVTHARSGILLVHFRPAGAAAFVRSPLHELMDTTAPLDALWGRSAVDELTGRCREARDTTERLARIERWLLARLSPASASVDPLLAGALGAIEATRGSLRIAALARELGVGQDRLEQRFRRGVGTSPKHLASLTRMKHALTLRPGRGSWAAVAQASGYFDEAHFSREFRALTGQPPGQFFRATAFC